MNSVKTFTCIEFFLGNRQVVWCSAREGLCAHRDGWGWGCLREWPPGMWVYIPWGYFWPKRTQFGEKLSRYCSFSSHPGWPTDKRKKWKRASPMSWHRMPWKPLIRALYLRTPEKPPARARRTETLTNLQTCVGASSEFPHKVFKSSLRLL